MSRRARLVLVVVFLALLWALFEASGLKEKISIDALHDQFVHHRVLGLASFSALFALGNLIQLPGWLFLAAAVLALGRLWGALATYLAATIACASTFGIVRLLGGDALRDFQGRAGRWIFARLDAHPVQSVLLLRLLFQTLPALNCALALTGIGWGRYLLGTVLGLPLPIALYSVFFDALARALHWPVAAGG